MERFQQKRSHGRGKPYHGCTAKVVNSLDGKSGSNFVPTERVLGEGSRQNRKLADTSKDASKSGSCSNVPKNEDSFESRRSSLKQASGSPMKKLLAKELSKEMESRRRPPSVIARLMGLDALPPQQPVYKQQKRLSENNVQRTMSSPLQEKRTSHEFCSFRMNIEEQQEFKDIFEVSKVEKRTNLSVQTGTANSKLNDAKIAFIRQKFMDAKRLSTDERLKHSKELHDALEVLDSNKDLLLKYLQEPDSMFTKQVHELHGVPLPCQSGHITILKSSSAPKYENTDLCLKPEVKTEHRDVMSSLQKHDSNVCHCHSRHSANNSYKLSKSRYEEKDETCPLPTRIVVLKPNLGKVQNTARSVSSPSHSAGFNSGYRKHSEFQSSENRELFTEVRDWKNSSDNVEYMRHRSKSSREIAKEITRQMRHSVSRSSTKVSSSGLRGYAGDESSCSMSENDSANESEVVAPISRDVLEWQNRYSPSSSHSTESSVSREAKKRLSERWKMTHRFQEVGLVGGGSTLGEMLAMPDRETSSMTLDSSHRLARGNGVSRRGSPMGISSRDGWKDGCSRNLQRSKSVPASSTAFESPKASIRHGALSDDRCLMPKEDRSRKGNSNHKDDSFLRSIRSRSKKSPSSLRSYGDNNCAVQEIHLNLGELRNSHEEVNQAERKFIDPEPPACDIADEKLVVEDVAIAETEDVIRPSETPEEQLPKSTACIMLVNDGGLSAHDSDDSIMKEATTEPPEETANSSHCLSPEPESPVIVLRETTKDPPEEGANSLHCPLPEPESPASAQEADYSSPVSVLESSFVEDMLPGSECFERVSADLHGLRMQLQLLKLESSDAYTDEFRVIVSSDEDTGEGSIGHLEDKEKPNGAFRAEESRDFSYLVDVLVDSGFHDVDRKMVLAACYSPESPVGPLVFEKLEKKYGEQLTWPKSERKLLFSRINYGLIEILRPSMDLHPWVNPVAKGVATGWCKEALVEDLWEFLVSQGKEGNNDSSETVLGRETRWLELEDDIDVVGREIEKLVLDELIQEIVSM